MKQFYKSNIEPEWADLTLDYPEIFLEVSQQVKSCMPNVPEEELCNLRFSFEMGVGWKQIVREFCEEIRALVKKAADNGHEIHYKSFILKEKFWTLRDQGDFYGPDSDIYRKEYYEISSILEKKSKSIDEATGKVKTVAFDFDKKQ